MSRLAFAFYTVVALAFGGLALGTASPRLEDMTRESAELVKVEVVNLASSRTHLRTESGRAVVCGHSARGSGCDPEAMKLLQLNRDQLLVWHDGAVARQVSARGQLLLSNDEPKSTRAFSAALAVLALMALCFHTAAYFGVIGTRRNPTDK